MKVELAYNGGPAVAMLGAEEFSPVIVAAPSEEMARAAWAYLSRQPFDVSKVAVTSIPFCDESNLPPECKQGVLIEVYPFMRHDNIEVYERFGLVIRLYVEVVPSTSATGIIFNGIKIFRVENYV